VRSTKAVLASGIVLQWINSIFASNVSLAFRRMPSSHKPGLAAVSVYVLIAIVKKRPHLDASLYALLQILSLILFEKMSLQQALQANEYVLSQQLFSDQLDLFAN
jgi:hypothetical protein